MGSSFNPPVAAPLRLTTTAGEIQRWSYDSTHYVVATIDSFGQLTFDQEPGFSMIFSGGGNTFMSIGSAVTNRAQGNYAISGATYAADTARYVLTDGVSGIGIPAASQVSLVANGADIVIASGSTLAIKSGVSLKLGNAAVTGLIAGALAALTNATVTMQDSSGQVYRFPCII